MKTSRNQANAQSKQGMTKKPIPEIRDNLDSRKNEEYLIKGDDITHTTRPKHNKNKQKG